MFRKTLAVGILAAALVTGCGASTRVTSEATSLAEQGATGAASTEAEGGPRGVENFRPGQPVLVANQFDLAQRGFVAWNDLYPPPGRAPEHLVPVRDAAGRKIALWGVDIGWIDLTTAEAPGFTYEKAHDAEMERVHQGR